MAVMHAIPHSVRFTISYPRLAQVSQPRSFCITRCTDKPPRGTPLRWGVRRSSEIQGNQYSTVMEPKTCRTRQFTHHTDHKPLLPRFLCMYSNSLGHHKYARPHGKPGNIGTPTSEVSQMQMIAQGASRTKTCTNSHPP